MRLALAALVCLVGCGNRDPGPSRTRPAPGDGAPVVGARAATTDAGPAVGADAGLAGAAAGEPLTTLTDAALMAELERRGASLAALLDGAAEPLANDALAERPRYKSLLRVFEDDVRAAAQRDKSAGVGMAFGHRLLDVKTLRAKAARFELVGVAQRLDRGHVRPGACGELRFVYRLAYQTTVQKVVVASRLPATLAVTFWLAPPSEAGAAPSASVCRAVAQRWHVGAVGVSADALLAADGPIGPLAALAPRFKAVEANLQVVRWPSTTRPDLAGHAEYVLRVFEASGAELAPAPLENTLDEARFSKKPAEVAALSKLVRENLDAIDAGTFLFPREWLTKKSLSVSPRGHARLTNRPFSQLVSASAFADLTLEGRRTVGSPAALLRRLDQLSCPGCHQSRSVAGFHLLGEDRVAGANSIALPLSPHAIAEQGRRVRGARALARGEPYPSHPMAERDDAEPGVYGARCGLGDAGFARWTCAAGLVCQPADHARGEGKLVGTCLPPSPAVGDPCEHATVSLDPNGMRDRATLASAACGPGAACSSNLVGFPGGLCSVACGALGAHPDGVCTGIPILTSFNACLARNEPFEQCVAANTRPSGVRACSAAAPCREDYICAGSPTVAHGEGRGACMPPYFLFQLRVDGHPVL